MGGASELLVPCGKTFCPAASICCNAVCGTCSTTDGACPDIGCTDPFNSCEGAPIPPVVLGCAYAVGTAAQPEIPVNFTVPQCVVSTELSGVLEGGCLEPLIRNRGNGPELAAQAVAFTVTDGDRYWNAEVVVEGNNIPSLLGQKVRLDYRFEPGGFGPDVRHLALVSYGSRSHGVWIAEGGDIPDLGALPLQLISASVVCSSTEQCGSYERYDLAATDPVTMAGIRVPYAQAAQLGPWVIAHGGYEEQTSAGTCPDWFVAHAQVGILGLM